MSFRGVTGSGTGGDWVVVEVERMGGEVGPGLGSGWAGGSGSASVGTRGASAGE